MRRLFLMLFVAFMPVAIWAHTPFNGLLTDCKGKPVKKCRVYVKSPREYTLSDKAGRFGLTDVNPDDTLTVVVKKRTFRIPVDGRRSAVIKIDTGNLDNTPTVSEDERLVDWGFGYVSRREYTGVSNYISGDELRKSGYRTVIESLQGRVPGLNITGGGGNGASLDVSMRGTRSITDGGMPVLVLNGMVVPDFDGISLNDVDYVEVLKEAGIYGAGGSNGAIIVHTK